MLTGIRRNAVASEGNRQSFAATAGGEGQRVAQERRAQREAIRRLVGRSQPGRGVGGWSTAKEQRCDLAADPVPRREPPYSVAALDVVGRPTIRPAAG
jgi:hypothetical protein